jgi:hypothetical protein
MDEQHLTTTARPRLAGLLDYGARWFEARAERRDPPPLGEHGHWDPAIRDWRYHTHETEARRAG